MRRAVNLDDLQALARFGHGHLLQSRFLLLTITNEASAGRWLQQLPVTSAATRPDRPDTAVQIAFTPTGLSRLGLPDTALARFSDEFLSGMSGDDNRSRRLGDVEHNAPAHWRWGHENRHALHVLLLLYAKEGSIEQLVRDTCNTDFEQGFAVAHELPTDLLRATEPFGFVDGISQPEIDWQQTQRTDVHARSRYSNRVAPGEIVLGYHDEYGQTGRRPLIDADSDNATLLPEADGLPGLREFGGNGSYLVVRQLAQDVDGFWQYLRAQSNQGTTQAEELAARMVGRYRNGEPLVPPAERNVPGIPRDSRLNAFDYDADPAGLQCPLGAHIRRSNPRSGDFPPDSSTLWVRLVRMLGFGRANPHEDLVASSRFHRILRRGRTYGGPDASTSPSSATGERGLQFISIGSNILRQFEFVQSAWAVSSFFAGTRQQRDPLIGHRQPRVDGSATSAFVLPRESGVHRKISPLPSFVTVRGGGYFFLPGLSAIHYLSQRAQHTADSTSPPVRPVDPQPQESIE